MKNLALSILYLLGFVMLSSWSVSFGEMFGVNVSAIPQFILAMLFTLIIGGYMGLPLIYIKFKRSETLFFLRINRSSSSP